MLQALGHSGFEVLLLELNLEDTGAGQGSGLLARVTSLASFALKNPEARTPDGIPLQPAIVAWAGEVYRRGTTTNITRKERDAFEAASATAASMNNVTVGSTDFFYPASVLAAEAQLQPSAQEPKAPRPRSNKVFIVHGHEEAPRLAVAR